MRYRIAVLLTAALVAAGLSAGAGTASAGPGVAPDDDPQRTITYEVRTRGTVLADVGTFRRIAAETFNDRRGWSLGGSIRFREVGSGGTFTLWLAAPSTLPGFSPVCSPEYSCRVGRNVVINDERWREGTSTWPAVREYQHYVLNHELGHWMGLGHTSCGGSGQLAPVMQQQSISLGGCGTNTWPTDAERRAGAANRGVSVRSESPDLYAVKQHGGTGTEVHVLDGDDLFARFESHHRTPAGPTAARAWDFSVADRDRDGVDDVIGIKRWGDSGRVELHVLDGASGYSRWQYHVATRLPRSAFGQWSFDVADVDGDGILDLVGVSHFGSGGRTTVHVLDGAAGYQRFLTHAGTPLPHTSVAAWQFTMGNHDRDGIPDLYVIERQGQTGTEVNVLDGARGYDTWAANAGTPFPPTEDNYEFAVDDLDGDGWDEVYGIKREGSTGGTEAHVLADRSYSRFVAHGATVLPSTLGQPGWRFPVD
jgi:Protein of unknown function (DUF3152)